MVAYFLGHDLIDIDVRRSFSVPQLHETAVRYRILTEIIIRGVAAKETAHYLRIFSAEHVKRIHQPQQVKTVPSKNDILLQPMRL